MRRADAICGLILLAIGVIVVYDSRRYGVFGWGAAGPEPGLYPFLLGVGLILTTLVVLAQVLMASRASGPDQRFIPPGALKPILCVGIPATLMIFLTDYIDLYLAAGLYLAVYMRWIGKHRWVTIAAVSILIPLAGYMMFEKWFLIPLPEGSLTGGLGF